MTSVLFNDGTVNQTTFAPLTYNIDYSYDTLLYDAKGRGSLGFHKVTSTDSRTGFSVVRTFGQAYPFTGRLMTEVVFQSDGVTSIQETTNTWTKKPFGLESPQREFVFLDKKESEYFEFGGPSDGTFIRRVTTDPTYEYPPPTELADTALQRGYLLSETVEVDTSATASTPSDPDFRTVTTYTPNRSTDAQWCLSAVDYVSVARSQKEGGSTITETRDIDYVVDLSKCRVTSDTVLPNLPTGDDKYKSQTTYSYDGRGNPIGTAVTGVGNITDYGNGQPFAPRVSKVEFDAEGQFPERMVSCYDDTSVSGCASSDTNNPYTTLSWDDKFGRTATLTGVLGQHPSNFLYDNFGRSSASNLSDGNGSETRYEDCPFGGSTACWVSDAKMRVVITRDTGEDVSILLDSLGREVGRETAGFSGDIRSERVYDSLGRVIQQSMPYKASASSIFWRNYDYDDVGRVTAVREPKSDDEANIEKTTSFSYDRFTTITTNAENQKTKQVVDAIGRVIESYDTSHSPSAPADDSIVKANAYVAFTYSPWDELLTTTNHTDGTTITRTYDPRGRLASVDDPDRGYTSYEYDPSGALVKTTDANLEVRTLVYDSLGRLIRRDDEGRSPAYYRYSNDGSGTADHPNAFGQIYERSVGGHKVEYRYDTRGRVVKMSEFIPTVTGYPVAGAFDIDFKYYDTTGQLEWIQYPEIPGNAGAPSRLKVKYNYTNGWASVAYNADVPSEFFYSLISTDEWGNPKLFVNGNSVSTTRDYDKVNGWLSGAGSAGPGNPNLQDYRVEYDMIGNVVERKDWSGVIVRAETFHYDPLNRLTSVDRTVDGNPTVGSLVLTYHQNGNIKSKSDFGTSYTYGTATNGPHRVASVVDNGETVGSYTYDAKGNMTHRNGYQIEWLSFGKSWIIRTEHGSTRLYDDSLYSRYRQIETQGSRSAETLYVGGLFERHASFLGSGGIDVIGYRHAIMANGERIATKNYVEVPSTTDTDADGVVDPLDNCAVVANATQTDTDGDGFGNACDPDLDGDDLVNFIDLGLLRAAFFSRPVDNPNTTDVDESANWNPDADFNGDNVVNFVDLGILRTYILVAGPGPAGTAEMGWSTRYFHKDHLMSITKVTDESGTLTQSFSYDAFGKGRDPDTWEPPSNAHTPVIPEGVEWSANNRGFTDHEQLHSVRMIHMNGRIYEPDLGRFISSDPYIPDPLSTQSYNRLSYVRNNPLSATDPSGFLDIGPVNINLGPIASFFVDVWRFISGRSSGGSELDRYVINGSGSTPSDGRASLYAYNGLSWGGGVDGFNWSRIYTRAAASLRRATASAGPRGLFAAVDIPSMPRKSSTNPISDSGGSGVGAIEASAEGAIKEKMDRAAVQAIAEAAANPVIDKTTNRLAEQGGWIYFDEKSGSYQFTRTTQGSSEVVSASNPPKNTVGWWHSHPYAGRRPSKKLDPPGYKRYRGNRFLSDGDKNRRKTTFTWYLGGSDGAVRAWDAGSGSKRKDGREVTAPGTIIWRRFGL